MDVFTFAPRGSKVAFQTYHFADRPTAVKVWHTIIEILVASIVTIIFFFFVGVVPFFLCLPLLSAMESASLILVILAPCFVIYGTLLSSLSYRKVKV